MFGRGIFFLLAVTLALVAILFSNKTSTPVTHPKPSQWPGRNNTVLFVSNSERGFANVLLATSHAMLVEHSDIEVHYASFKNLAKEVSTISRFAMSQNANVQSITFHTLKGPTFSGAIDSLGFDMDQGINGPGISGLTKFLSNIQDVLMPWSGSAYLGLYREVLAILDEVDPHVVAVDPLFGPGLDATRAQGRNYAIVSPNALKDRLAFMQPWGSVFWKYPV